MTTLMDEVAFRLLASFLFFFLLLFSVFSEDCTYFDLEAPDFSLAEETKINMEEYSQMWGLYEEWQQGFTEKAQEDWITFR